MSVINISWNNKTILSAKSLDGYKDLNGDVWEFIITDSKKSYRVFRNFYDSKYYVYILDPDVRERLISVVGCSGKLERYLGKNLTKNFVTSGSEYNLLEDKLSIKNSGKIYLNNKLVAAIGSENRFTWLCKIIFRCKVNKYNPWSGIKFNTYKIDESLALTLIVSSMANLDS